VTSAFRNLLANTLVSGVTSSFLWFALIFWVYLETRSVVVTGVVGGAFSISSALLGPVFGTYVDRHRKRDAMVLATTIAAISFTLATAIFVTVDSADLLRLTSPWFWALTIATLLGSVAGQLRSIPMSTCVTLLVADEVRDRANGLVGTVTGLSFAITSVFSGLVIDTVGMGWAYYGALALTVGALLHLTTISVPGDEVAPREDDAPTGMVDVRSAVDAIRTVPGLGMLIALAAFNNLLAGVFMALMDAYGLELVSVSTWGFLWGFISLFMIAGGIVVSRVGLGKVPLRAVLIGNLVNWAVCSVFAIQSSIVLLTIGMCVWLGLMPMIEAAEQTVLQRAIPYERQGRVFGFAQLVENAASPLTAFAIAPVAEAVFMPLMTDGSGADLIGSWFGTGPERGIGLMFTIAGLVGVAVTMIARLSRSYRALAVESMAPADGGAELAPVA
jgi:DHA3 family multidrug efflux protein-like MFS transporter